MKSTAFGASALLYSALAAVLGRDVLARAGTTIANDPGDPLLTAAILHWNAHHVPFTDAWWQFPIFHPTADTIAFSEHLLGLSVIAAPIAWVTGNPLLTYNLTLLLTFPLSAMAMFALVSYVAAGVERRPDAAVLAGAFLAGLAYGFAPYRISNLPHIQMLASFWAPLALLGLHAYLSSGRRRWLAVFGAGWLLQAAANWYALVFFSVLVGLWILWFVVAPRKWRALAEIMAAAALALVPLIPLLSRYLAVHAVHGFERSLGEMRTYSADVAAVFCAPSALSWWGWIRIACRGEGELFPGVAIAAIFVVALAWTVRQARGAGPPPRAVSLLQRGLLVVAFAFAAVVASVIAAGPWAVDIGVARVSASEIDKPMLVALAAVVLALTLALGTRAFRRPPSEALSFYVFAAVVTWTLALGPTLTLMGELSGRPGPFALLQWLPGVGGLRVPARFWLMTTVCLAVVVGLFVTQALRHRRSGVVGLATLLLALGVLGDGWSAPIPPQPPPTAIPGAHALAGQVVLQFPAEPFPDIAATWRAATGGWRSVNGYSGFAPRYYEALRTAARIADPGVLTPFRHETPLHVVVADEAADVRTIVEDAGGEMIGRGNAMSHYRLPALAAPPRVAAGERLRVAAVTATCHSEQVSALFDGDERTRWECLENADRQPVVIDLGRPHTIRGLVYSQGAASWIVPAGLEIESSLDAAAWTPARSGSVLGELIDGGMHDPAALRAELTFPPREARYVRVRPVPPPGEFAWLVAELQVLGR